MSPDVRDLELVRLDRQRGEAPGISDEAQAAFARLYDRHAPVVRALCRANCRSEEDADDALQETFIRAYRMLDKVEDGAGFRTWLYAIARLVCSERRRAEGRRAKHEHAAREQVAMPNHAQGGAAMSHTSTGSARPSDLIDAPAQSADRAEQLERLTRAMEQLPDDERLAVHLYYLETDPVAAATDCLGVSRSGFYKLLTRAREHLASLMVRAEA